MAKPPPGPKQAGPISLYPLSPDRALAAALRVKPADLKWLEADEAAKKAANGKGRKK
jgi:hypothetical protein